MHRFELTYRLLEEVVAGIEEVQAEGDGELAQLLDLVMIGDFTSIHLALQAGVDPGPIPAIDHIKQALATSAGERRRSEDTEGAPS
jgi:glucose/mannose-6-phosphate isomerase